MANEMVNYHNELNKVALRNFTPQEIDILITICSRMKDKKSINIEFSFEDLKKLTNIESNYTTEQFSNLIKSSYSKLLNCKLGWETEEKIVQFVLFTEYEVDKIQQTVMVGVNEKYHWVLNELAQNFTKFELQEFVDLRSSYAKEFFRRMKQFRATGIWKVSLDEFKRLLDIPVNYRMCHIDDRVLKPIQKELGEKYDLKIKKRYSSKGRGRPTVSGFEFKFNKEISSGKTKRTEEINLNIFTGRKIRMYDSIYDRYNVMTILSIEGKEMPAVRLQNVDDGYIQEFAFNSSEHFMNWFEKNKI